jgi:hypothetical protein
VGGVKVLSEHLNKTIDNLANRIDELIMLRAGLIDRRPIDDADVPRIALADALCDLVAAIREEQ